MDHFVEMISLNIIWAVRTFKNLIISFISFPHFRVTPISISVAPAPPSPPAPAPHPRPPRPFIKLFRNHNSCRCSRVTAVKHLPICRHNNVFFPTFSGPLKLFALDTLSEHRVSWGMLHFPVSSWTYSVKPSRLFSNELFMSERSLLSHYLICSCNLSRDMTKPIKWLCAQRRLRSAWASAKSDIVFAVRSMGS